MSAALAVNQFLPGYHLSAPQPLSYYSAAVHSSSSPAWSDVVRSSAELCSQSPLSSASQDVSSRTVSWGLPPQVSETFFSSSCQSFSSLTSSLIPCPLPASLPPTLFFSLSLSFWVSHKQSRLFSFSLASSGLLSHCRPQSLLARCPSLCHTSTHTHTFLSSSILLLVLQVWAAGLTTKSLGIWDSYEDKAWGKW